MYVLIEDYKECFIWLTVKNISDKTLSAIKSVTLSETLSVIFREKRLYVNFNTACIDIAL